MMGGNQLSDKQYREEDKAQSDTSLSASNVHSLASSLSKLSVGRRQERRNGTKSQQKESRRVRREHPGVPDQLEDLFRVAEEAFVTERKTRMEDKNKISFSTRCVKDSNVLIADCPESMRHIDALFVKQIDAIELADQCNEGLGTLPRPELVVSKNSNVPVQRVQGGLYMSASAEGEDQTKQQEEGGEEEDEDTIPAHHMFDCPEEDVACPDIYDDDDDALVDERINVDLRQKYMDILSELNKGMDVQKSNEEKGEDKVEENQEDQAKEKVGDDEAILSQPRHPNRIRIFCREFFNASKGTYYRKFNACSVAAAWKVYLENDPAKLHWYEVIRENFPCHLYFDLEFPKDAEGLNETIQGDAYVDVLLECVRKTLREGFSLDFVDTDVYELDSSSEAKFSRHLIVKIQNHAFYNNIAVGDFVAQVLLESGTSLLVKDKHGKDVYFVDTAVYTKNRHFRLAYSCKGGRKATLMPTKRFVMTRQPLPTPAQIFKETIVTSVDPSAKLLTVRPLHQMSSSKVQKAGSGLKHQPDRGHIKKDTKEMLPDAASMKRLQSIANAAVPFIEQFGTKRAGKTATVRTVQICGGHGLVAYSMYGDGAHYCGNIGRDHKSNFIYYVANFSNLTLVQKCHDVDCRKYKSTAFDLPMKFLWKPYE